MNKIKKIKMQKRCQASVCDKDFEFWVDGLKLCEYHKDFYKNDFTDVKIRRIK